MTMAAALIAAVTEIDLKRFKFATVQCRESVCALSVLLLSRWGDGGQGEGGRGVLANPYESKLYLLTAGVWVWNEAHLGSDDSLLRSCFFDS